jgi:hypothetical protein
LFCIPEEKVYVSNDQQPQQQQQQQQPTRHQKWAIVIGVASLLFIFDGLQVCACDSLFQ